MSTIRLLTLVLVCVLSLSACGGGDDTKSSGAASDRTAANDTPEPDGEAQAARKGLRMYATAVSDKDEKGICKRLAGYAELASDEDLDAAGGETAACEKDYASQAVPETGRQVLEQIDKAEVEVDGNKAKITINGGVTSMRRAGGVWKFDLAATTAAASGG